jgi:hypothetical protein
MAHKEVNKINITGVLSQLGVILSDEEGSKIENKLFIIFIGLI